MGELSAEQALILVQSVLLGIIKNESRTTKSVLSAVPNAKVDYRPDPCAKTAIELVRHIAVAENRRREWGFTCDSDGSVVKYRAQ